MLFYVTLFLFPLPLLQLLREEEDNMQNGHKECTFAAAAAIVRSSSERDGELEKRKLCKTTWLNAEMPIENKTQSLSTLMLLLPSFYFCILFQFSISAKINCSTKMKEKEHSNDDCMQQRECGKKNIEL
jgi:hypothetical protein